MVEYVIIELTGGDGCLACPNSYGAIFFGKQYHACKHADKQSEAAHAARRTPQ